MTVGMPMVDASALFRVNPAFLQGKVPASTALSSDPLFRECSPDRQPSAGHRFAKDAEEQYERDRDYLPVGPDHRRARGPGPPRPGVRVWLSRVRRLAGDATDRAERDPRQLGDPPLRDRLCKYQANILALPV